MHKYHTDLRVKLKAVNGCPEQVGTLVRQGEIEHDGPHYWVQLDMEFWDELDHQRLDSDGENGQRYVPEHEIIVLP